MLEITMVYLLKVSLFSMVYFIILPCKYVSLFSMAKCTHIFCFFFSCRLKGIQLYRKLFHYFKCNRNSSWFQNKWNFLMQSYLLYWVRNAEWICFYVLWIEITKLYHLWKVNYHQKCEFVLWEWKKMFRIKCHQKER